MPGSGEMWRAEAQAMQRRIEIARKIIDVELIAHGARSPQFGDVLLDLRNTLAPTLTAERETAEGLSDVHRR